MRIRWAWLCLCLGGALAGWAEGPAPSAAPADRSVGDVSNVTEYLREKFQIPTTQSSVLPPGPDDLAAEDGRIFRNVQVWRTEPDGLTVRHDEGLTKLEFPLLPEDWRTKYGYDPAVAAAYRQSVADAVREAERTQRLLREQIDADRAEPGAE